ncbi:hypothetical protein KEM55_001754 [Ascosphaera atra]|nr:hypothetical protein KEM55_001754 [Ascosphaera atra]
MSIFANKQRALLFISAAAAGGWAYYQVAIGEGRQRGQRLAEEETGVEPHKRWSGTHEYDKDPNIQQAKATGAEAARNARERLDALNAKGDKAVEDFKQNLNDAEQKAEQKGAETKKGLKGWFGYGKEEAEKGADKAAQGADKAAQDVKQTAEDLKKSWNDR